MNIIRLLKNDRIRILFSLKKTAENEYYLVWKNRPNTNTNIIQFEKSKYYSAWKKQPNTNIIRFEKIDRIRIQILFSLKKSPEYEYEYYYWASTIRIIFKYWIIRSPLVPPTPPFADDKFKLFPPKYSSNILHRILHDWTAIACRLVYLPEFKVIIQILSAKS